MSFTGFFPLPRPAATMQARQGKARQATLTRGAGETQLLLRAHAIAASRCTP